MNIMWFSVDRRGRCVLFILNTGFSICDKKKTRPLCLMLICTESYIMYTYISLSWQLDSQRTGSFGGTLKGCRTSSMFSNQKVFQADQKINHVLVKFTFLCTFVWTVRMSPASGCLHAPGSSCTSAELPHTQAESSDRDGTVVPPVQHTQWCDRWFAIDRCEFWWLVAGHLE